MSRCNASHEWVVAPFRLDRAAAPRQGDAEWHEVNAHRNIGGAYTAAGELIRQLLEGDSALDPDLLVNHQVTLASLWPGALSHICASDGLAEWLNISREGNGRSWTLRLAHGLTDFLLAYAAHPKTPRLCLSFEHAEQADSLDQEFLSVLLRRARPDRLIVRICSSSDGIRDPLKSALETYARTMFVEPAALPCSAVIPEPWRIWLKRIAAGWAGEWAALTDLSEYLDLSAVPPSFSTLQEFLDDAVTHIGPAERLKLVSEHVGSECTSDRLILKHAYSAAPPEDRTRLHLARAVTLDALNRDDLALGAVPFHYEKASAHPEALLTASKRCMHLAYYEAALDWSLRGRDMIAATHRDRYYSEFTRNTLFSLLLLGRFDEVEAICDNNLSQSDDPALLAHTTYARAILTARLYEPARRDFEAARGWVVKSMAFTEMLPASEIRAVNLAFLRNTLALVEMRTGRFQAAHELLTAALDYIAKEAPGKYAEECVLLLHNRARLQIALKRTDAAIDDLTTLLGHQPGNSEAYLDRGLLRQRAGKHEDALRDYNAAIRWSPPYPEPYFNRAQTLVSLGRRDEALASYNYVLTWAPHHVEALTNRGCLLYQRGMFAASRIDVDAALRLSGRHARLLCLRGLLALQEGNLDGAYESFTESIEADPSLPDPWANRGIVLFKRGDAEGALLDLTHALSLREDGAAFYNRGRIFEAGNKWAEAVEDYSRALELATGGTEPILRRLHTCRTRSQTM